MTRWLLAVMLIGCGSSPAMVAPDAPPAATCGDGLDAALCAGAAGTFHAQAIVVGDETRNFYLHVPAKAVGGAPAPLVVDFHGTGFTDDKPEEEWGIPELEAASDELGFIVVRPRSHSYVAGGQTLYQWDLDAHDLAGNLALAQALVELVATHYAVAPARVYAAGFSNGTNMALQTIAIPQSPFHGFGIVGGGIYYPFPVAGWSDPAPRIWATSGYRDLNYLFQRDMSAWLATNHYPMASLAIRETKGLHELRGWMYREMFAWLDAGTRPADGALATGWSAEAFPSAASSLLALAGGASGRVIASGADGSLWARTAGGWAATRAATDKPVLLAACLDGAGGGLATGETVNLTTTDDGATWQSAPGVPHTTNAAGATSQLFALACGPGGARVGGGAAFTAASMDAGATWQVADIPAFPFGIRRGASGAWIAVGPDWAGRSTDGGATYATAALPNADLELYDVAEAAAGHWWAVGVDGKLATSTDDGATWSAVASPTTESLYAVRFASAQVGLAVGAHGAAIVTRDGGATWVPAPTGLDRMLADVWWQDATHAIVVGERGLVLDFAAP